MDWIFEPSMWVSLITLIILELVLGIDNLIFISILSNKLPEEQRDKARKIGLCLALLMRLVLLRLVSWITTLTTPVIVFLDGKISFSWRDLILLSGGIFLLFKATSELHERMESKSKLEDNLSVVKTSFLLIIFQILLLDVVFSIDSIITAVGMTNNLYVMMAAVIITIIIMLIASKPLADFVGKHPTVVILCLSFLLMIGFSLILESFHVHVPKGYLYAAIAFSIMIEALNQMTDRNAKKNHAKVPIRVRAISKVSDLILGEVHNEASLKGIYKDFEFEKKLMTGVLNLAERPFTSIFLKKENIVFINIEKEKDEIIKIIEKYDFREYPLIANSENNVFGLALAKDLLIHLNKHSNLKNFNGFKKPVFIEENSNIYDVFKAVKRAKRSAVLVKNNKGGLVGLLSKSDLLEALAGEFPTFEKEFKLVFNKEENFWLAKGDLNMYLLEQELLSDSFVSKDDDYILLKDFMLNKLNSTPQLGSIVELDQYRFEILNLDGKEVNEVKITKI